MQGAAAALGLRSDYAELALRTRTRRHLKAGCHSPGCWERAVSGKHFCTSCQATLDRVRNELKAQSPARRKPKIRKAVPR
jgi:rRNA maturation endonuclease Nob1